MEMLPLQDRVWWIQLAKVPDFDADGAIHVIVNNHISFTTSPIHSCSITHCLGIGMTFGAPILHCNRDDPLDVSCDMETAM
eukprot:15339981-Ditylum_brightwellii.AAC.1